MPKVMVIIPAFNEENEIFNVVLDVSKYFSNIVVIDDGSTDKTGEKAKQAGARVLSHIINRGQGAALLTGTLYAIERGAEIIVHFDGDGQHTASEIPKLIEPILKNEADVVLGSRFLTQGIRGALGIPWSKKYFILLPARIFTCFTTGLKLTDIHNGLRALNRKAAELIQITHDRMAHNSEVLSEIKKKNLRYKEVPVTIYYKKYGQGFFDGIKIFLELLKGKIL